MSYRTAFGNKTEGRVEKVLGLHSLGTHREQLRGASLPKLAPTRGLRPWILLYGSRGLRPWILLHHGLVFKQVIFRGLLFCALSVKETLCSAIYAENVKKL